MNKKINKKKIVKYAATGLLVATLTSGCGIAIHDTSIEHVDEICPVTKVFTYLGNSESVLFNYGVSHQASQMTDELEKQGYDASVNFNAEHYDTKKIVYKIMPLIHYDSKTGEKVYTTPAGYTLIEEDGKYYAEKIVTSKSLESYMAFETKLTENRYVNPIIIDGKKMAPEGYILIEKDDNYYAMKQVVSHNVLKLK